MIGYIVTGTGIWNPLIWMFAVFVILLSVIIFRSFGEGKYSKYTNQVKPFVSGSEGYEHIRSENLYWGFFRANRLIYKLLKDMHTGKINDYIYWFTLVLVIFMALVIL